MSVPVQGTLELADIIKLINAKESSRYPGLDWGHGKKKKMHSKEGRGRRLRSLLHSLLGLVMTVVTTLDSFDNGLHFL
jgi:hypothetical protein